MKQFVRTAIATALLFATIAAGLTLIIKHRDCRDKYKSNYMHRHKADIKTLVVGHSHMMNGVDPTMLGDSCFNVAIPGTTMDYTRLLLEHYLPQMPRLHTVILPLSHDMESWRDENQHVIRNRLVYGHYFKLWITPPTLVDRLAFLHSNTFLKLESIDTTKLGFASPSKQFDGNQQYAKQFSRNSTVLPNLVKIGQLCHEHGVRLIVVVTPFAPSYRSHVTQDEKDRIIGIVDSVRSQVPFDYRSYLADPDFGSDTLFHDGTHLNCHGAIIFSRKLKQDFDL